MNNRLKGALGLALVLLSLPLQAAINHNWSVISALNPLLERTEIVTQTGTIRYSVSGDSYYDKTGYSNADRYEITLQPGEKTRITFLSAAPVLDVMAFTSRSASSITAYQTQFRSFEDSSDFYFDVMYDSSRPTFFIYIGIKGIENGTYNVSYTIKSQITVSSIVNVAFNGNGNTAGAAPSVISGYSGDKIWLPAKGTLDRVGYDFSGWNTSSAGNGTTYQAESLYGLPSTDITLFAKWTAKIYTVTLAANGGAGGTASVNATYGQSMSAATAPTRSGYTFQGYWDTSSASGGTQYYTASMVSARNWDKTSSATLYARWTPQISGYTVTLNANGGSGGTASVNATYGQSMPAATAPTRSGYTFQGYWDTSSASGGTQYYTTAMGSARNWDKTSSVSLYARWQANTYAVTLNANGGSGGTASVNATYGQSMSAATAPTRSGYTFQGYWDTSSASGGTQYYTTAMGSARNWDKTSSVSLYARWESETISDYLYTISNGTVTITRYMLSAAGGSITIPSTIEGYPVTCIGSHAFDEFGIFGSWSGYLTSVTIPSGVTSIGDHAFYWCRSLTSVTIPGSVTSIGDYAFGNCALVSVTIPGSVTSIGDYAFGSCALVSVTIPGNVTSIGNSAFDCFSLTNILVASANPAYTSENGVLFNKNKTVLIQCPCRKSGTYQIPNGVISISDKAFNECNFLTSVTIPNGMLSIGNWAFYQNWHLTSIAIPDSVTSIGDGAFFGCGLTNILVASANPAYTSEGGILFNKNKTVLIQCPGGISDAYQIPDGVTDIGNYAFYYCNLTRVTIPGSVTSIGDSAFSESSLTNIYFKGNAPSLTSIDGFGYHATIYYVSGTTGWEATFDRQPTAVWTSVATFNGDGGTPSFGSHTYNAGNAYGELPNATHSDSDYTFDGWWTGAGGTGSQVVASTLVPYVTAGHTLHAKWTGPYKVTFDVQGGMTVDGAVTVTNGYPYGALPLSEKTGYAFAGWWTGPDKTGLHVTDSTTVAVALNHTLYAGWTGNSYKVTFDAQGGVMSAGTKTVVYGAPYAALPAPTAPWGGRVGYVFDGWWTDAGGAGTHITETMTVATALDHTLYANWIRDGYLCEPSGNAVLTKTGSYDGYFYGEGDFNGSPATAVRGTLNVKITKPTGALTAKAVLQTGALSFSAKAWSGTEADGTFRATLAARGGETLDLHVRQDRIWGTLAGGSVGGTLSLDGARNRFAAKGDAAAQALLNAFTGYYTVALPAYDGLSLGAAKAAPQGVGYLAVTVGAKGSAKIAGVLADGTKVTQSSRLILFDGCGPEACVPFFVPLYAKRGWAGGLLWVTPNRGTVVTDRDLGWRILWEKPGAGPDGFRMLLDACGGFYGTGASLASAYLLTAEVGEVPYHYAGGATDWTMAPEGVPVAAAAGRMTIAKGVKPRKVAEDGDTWYEYDEVNPANATLSFTARSGLFKGKFILFYDYDLNGALQHKAVSVPYAGVLTPMRDGAFAELSAGLGHCLVPEGDPALKAYKIKRSFPVLLEVE